MILHTIIDLNEVMDPNYMKNFQACDSKRLENFLEYGVKFKKRIQVNAIFSTNPHYSLKPNNYSGKYL